MARRLLPLLSMLVVAAILLRPACPESVCSSSVEENGVSSAGGSGNSERQASSAADQEQSTESRADTRNPDPRSSILGQCRDVNDLFPAALPISPNKVLCNMTDVHNVNKTCFEEADARFFGALTEEIMSEAIVWCNLAMPNTGTTSLDSYMALGGAMPPLIRSGGCKKGCVSRVGTSTAPASTSLSVRMGFQVEDLKQCEPDLFRRLSALVRCPQSGGHMDWHSLEMMSRTCLRLRKNNVGGYEMKVAPGKDGKADVRNSMHKYVAPGTILRDPAKYHYKDYKVGSAPDWKDRGVCRVWDDAASAGKDTYGFACRKDECSSVDAESSGWCLDGDFNSYIRFAHHRWNIFTRMLAGTINPKHDPVMYYEHVEAMHSGIFTREMAVTQNEQGADAPDYKKAVQRLEQMPYFSIFERMSESVELLCFTFCYDCSKLGFEYKPKKRAEVPDDVVEEVNTYHPLDFMLYKHADALFSERIEWMRKAKAGGVQCDLLLSGCGLKCGDEDKEEEERAGEAIA